MEVDPRDLASLVRDKYEGQRSADIADDVRRLASGEPLAYVIGWMPFLGLKLRLDSHPLIPRPETEWWTELLIAHIKETRANQPLRILDLCAGSGAIGLAILARTTTTHVSFAELSALHAGLIALNREENNLDSARVDIRSGDLFAPFEGQTFDIIATNPPYIPSDRSLDDSVSGFEPPEALYAGEDGLDVIRRIAAEVHTYLKPGGEVWIECDISNIEEAARLLEAGGATRSTIHTDLYGRPRVVVGYFA